MLDYFRYRLARAFVKLIFILFGGIRIEGDHHLPALGPAIIASNHISVSDPPAVAIGVPHPLYFMAKEELFHIPVLRSLIRALHAFPVRPDTADRAALQRAEKLLRAGEIVLIFPEGRMSETGLLQEFQPGVALLSLRTGAPVIPAYLENTNCLVPYGSMLPQRMRKPVLLRFGAPIHIENVEVDRRQALTAGTNRIREAVVALSGADLQAREE